METHRKLKQCLFQVSKLFTIVLIIFVCVCCDKTKEKVNTTSKPCFRLPEIIKVTLKRDTIMEKDKLFGQIIFHEKLDKKINAKVFVTGKQIYINRDSTNFVFTPKFEGGNDIEKKNVDVKFIFSNQNCLDSILVINYPYYLIKKR